MSGGSKRTMVEATESDDDGTISSRTVQQRVDSCLSKMFESCEEDPKGSVHRSWGVTLVMMVFFFVVSIFESACNTYSLKTSGIAMRMPSFFSVCLSHRSVLLYCDVISAVT